MNITTAITVEEAKTRTCRPIFQKFEDAKIVDDNTVICRSSKQFAAIASAIIIRDLAIRETLSSVETIARRKALKEFRRRAKHLQEMPGMTNKACHYIMYNIEEIDGTKVTTENFLGLMKDQLFLPRLATMWIKYLGKGKYELKYEAGADDTDTIHHNSSRQSGKTTIAAFSNIVNHFIQVERMRYARLHYRL